MRRLMLPFALSVLLLLILGPGQALATNVSCGQTITQDTTLDGDLYCTGDGLVIGAPRITLNLNGHTIAGDDGLSDTGIRDSGYNGVTIAAGTVQDFGAGIRLEQASRATLSSLGVANNLNGGGISLSASNANTLSNISVTGTTADGLVITDSDRNRISGGTYSSNGNYGIEVVSGSGTKILNADLYGNSLDGIAVESGARRTLVQGNTSSINSDDGIDVTSASTMITGNTANFNGGWGIIAVLGVRDGGGNTASFNVAGNCQNVSC